MTFPPGDSLHLLRGVIDGMRPHTRTLTEEELQVALSEAPGPQASPLVQSANLRTAGFALDKIQPELLADFLAGYLAGRFGRTKAGIIGGNVSRIAETRE